MPDDVADDFMVAFAEGAARQARTGIPEAIEWLQENAEPHDDVLPEIIILLHHEDEDHGRWHVNGMTFERMAWHIQQVLHHIYAGELQEEG